jgi:hypothetical protein
MTTPQQASGSGLIQALTIRSATQQQSQIDFRQIASEISYYESIDAPGFTLTATLLDGAGFRTAVPLTGGEEVFFSFSDSEQNSPRISGSAIVSKLVDKVRAKESLDSYSLFLYPKELMLHNYEIVDTSFKSRKIEDIAKTIVQNHITPINGRTLTTVEPTLGQFTTTFPRISPFTALNYLAGEAQSADTKSSSRYFFFDTNKGYVFASLQYLMKQQIKRKFTLIEERIPGDSQYERNRIVSMEERVAFDLGEGVASGQLGTQILSLDPVAKRFRSTQYLYNRDYSSIDHISQERRLTARVAQQFGTRFSREAFIVTNSHQSTLPYVTERESSIQQSYRRRQDFLGVETAATADISSNITVITVHGDSTLHAGDTIEIMVPITGDRTIRDRAMDNLASGKYLVTAVAHRITTGGLTYVTVLECVKDAFIKRVENIVRDS